MAKKSNRLRRNNPQNSSPKHRPIVRGWRWQIIDGPPLPMSQAILVGEAVRYMAMEVHRTITGLEQLPDCLHGPYEVEGRNKDILPRNPREHPHAFWLPEDHNHGGLIDHILVHADAGLSRTAIMTLSACHRFYIPGKGDWDLLFQWAGEEVVGNEYGPSRFWRSRSPWFPSPRVHHLDSPDKHIRRELKLRGLPGLAKKPVPYNSPIPTRQFVRKRARDDHASAPRKGNFLSLELDKPHFGPLSLGFEAHFGLGQFVPVNESSIGSQ